MTPCLCGCGKTFDPGPRKRQYWNGACRMRALAARREKELEEKILAKLAPKRATARKKDTRPSCRVRLDPGTWDVLTDLALTYKVSRSAMARSLIRARER